MTAVDVPPAEPTVTDLERMVAFAVRLGLPDDHSYDDAGDPQWEWCRPDKRFGVCFGKRPGDTGWYFAHKAHPGASGLLTTVADLDQIAFVCGFFADDAEADEEEPGTVIESPIITTAKQRWKVGFHKRVALIKRILGLTD